MGSEREIESESGNESIGEDKRENERESGGEAENNSNNSNSKSESDESPENMERMDRLKEKFGDELEEKIKDKIDEFDGFLTRKAAIKLLDEKIPKKLEEIEDGETVKFKARVKQVNKKIEYKSGKISRSIIVGDKTDEKELVFWNEDTKIVDKLKVMDWILVKGAYQKYGRLNLGYDGKVKVKGSPFRKIKELEKGETVHIRGKIKEIEGYDKFVRGEEWKYPAKAFSFVIQQGEDKVQCIILKNQDRGEKLSKGDEILIMDAEFNKGNIDIDKNSRIFKKKEGSELNYNDGLIVDDKKLDREEALEYLGIEIADDIDLETIVKLKSI